MAEQLDFDPAMFGMKSNHGMLRSTAPPSQGSGANSVSVASGPRAVDSDPVAQSSNTYNSRGGQRGGRGGPNRGRGGGGNRGGRGRGGFNAGQQSGDGQPFKVIFYLHF